MAFEPLVYYCLILALEVRSHALQVVANGWNWRALLHDTGARRTWKLLSLHVDVAESVNPIHIDLPAHNAGRLKVGIKVGLRLPTLDVLRIKIC